MGVLNFLDGIYLYWICFIILLCVYYMYFLILRVYINYVFFLWGWILDYILKDDVWVC